MSTEYQPQTGVQSKKRNRLLCSRCRHDKQGCLPESRNWEIGEKCQRCYERGYDCGPPEKVPFKQRKRRVTVTNDPNFSELATSVYPVIDQSRGIAAWLADDLSLSHIGIGSEEQTQEVQEPLVQKLFACPVAKIYSRPGDPLKTYGACTSGMFDNIAGVRNHVIHVHALPDLFCLRCGDWFALRVDRERHMSECNSSSLGVRVVSSDNLVLQSQEQEKKWYNLYKAMFPGEQPPPHPYFEAPTTSIIATGARYQGDSWDAQNTSLTSKLYQDTLQRRAQTQTSIAGPELDGNPRRHNDTGVKNSQLFAPTDSAYASMHPNKMFYTDLPKDLASEKGTEYSTASIGSMIRNPIVQKFAEQILEDIGGDSLDESCAAAICQDLPDLLGDFALRLGQRCETAGLRNAMIFTYRYRSILSKVIERLIRESLEDDDTSEEKRRDNEMSAYDKMQMWQAGLNYQGSLEPPIEPDLETIEDDILWEEPEAIPEFDKYAEIVLGDCSYAWLLGKLRNKIWLKDNEDDVSSKIRHEVLRMLPKNSRVRSQDPLIFQAVLEVSWSLRSFLVGNFDDIKSLDIGQIITITGSTCDAQAMTCEQYMDQTWPYTGVHLLRMLRQIMNSHPMTKACSQRTDGAILEAWEAADTLAIFVSVTGTPGVIAETAEQLSWLSAALRTSLNRQGPVLCTPSVRSVRTPVDQLSSGVSALGLDKRYQPEDEWEKAASGGRDLSKLRNPPVPSREVHGFQIKTELQETNWPQTQGLCWHRMFHDTPMVHGFPIRRRQRNELGLEVSLEIAAELLGTKYINGFAGSMFVKGYSAILVPTLQIEDILVWHLATNLSGQYLSYLDHNIASPLEIDIEDVRKFRHVIGWCPEALNYAGAADCDYTVHRARLPRADAGCTLFDSVISFPQLLTNYGPSTVPKQQQTTHARRLGYLDMFRHLSQNFVLFWDTRDERGWLVNGISALLHLLRGSLIADERDSAGADFILNPSDLKEPTSPHSAKAPRKFLSQLENLRAKVSVTKVGMPRSHDKEDQLDDEYEVLNDRLEQYYYVLEKAIAYSKKLQSATSSSANGKLNFRLEGWDFVDLINKAELVDACTIALPSASHGWLELVWSTGITTLFGQGFGELIKPLDTTCCEKWKTLPTGNYYVAANIVDVKQIMEWKGNPYSEPRYLCESLLWHHPATAFEDCGCQESEGVDTKLIQQLCSTRRACVCPSIQHLSFDIDDYQAGAMIFGYNPAYGPLPTVENDRDSDSGYGSNLVETRTQDSDLTTSSISSKQPLPQDSGARQYGDGNVSGGRAHFGDTNVQYIYNYAMPPPSVQQSIMPTQRLHTPYQIHGESSGTKRSYSDAQAANTSLFDSQSEHASTDSDLGPPKRAKVTKRASSPWDLM